MHSTVVPVGGGVSGVSPTSSTSPWHHCPGTALLPLHRSSRHYYYSGSSPTMHLEHTTPAAPLIARVLPKLDPHNPFAVLGRVGVYPRHPFALSPAQCAKATHHHGVGRGAFGAQQQFLGQYELQ